MDLSTDDNIVLKTATMEDTYINDIAVAREVLLENCSNLEQVANYCEDNYKQSKDKRGALESTKNFTTQSLASVAYQINTLATSMLQMLDYTASQVSSMDSALNGIGLTIDLNNERIGRQTFKSSLQTPKACVRTRKVTKPTEPMNSKVIYRSLPIDYSSLDSIGHGIKLGLPDASPRSSRSGSLKSVSGLGSVNGSIRGKKVPSRSSIAQLESPLSRASSKREPFSSPPIDSGRTTAFDPPPPPPPPPSPPISETQALGSDNPPPPPPPTDVRISTVDNGEELPAPPRPVSLLIPPPPPLTQSPQQLSPHPGNGSANLLHVHENVQSPSPSKPLKASLSRKASRSPRPKKRPPPPPTVAAGGALPPPAHKAIPERSSPPPAATPAPPPPAPPGGCPAPPPPPPPPPIGGVKAFKATTKTSTDNMDKTNSMQQKTSPVQSGGGFAEQLKQRLANVQKETEDQTSTVGNGQQSSDNQTPTDIPPSTTTEGNDDPGVSSPEALFPVSTNFISQEEPDWAPIDFIFKVIAIYDYQALHADEMTFKEGDVIYITEDYRDGWFLGVHNGQVGMIPGNYVEQMP